MSAEFSEKEFKSKLRQVIGSYSFCLLSIYRLILLRIAPAQLIGKLFHKNAGVFERIGYWIGNTRSKFVCDDFYVCFAGNVLMEDCD